MCSKEWRGPAGKINQRRRDIARIEWAEKDAAKIYAKTETAELTKIVETLKAELLRKDEQRDEFIRQIRKFIVYSPLDDNAILRIAGEVFR